jgi:hypothetical protein
VSLLQENMHFISKNSNPDKYFILMNRSILMRKILRILVVLVSFMHNSALYNFAVEFSQDVAKLYAVHLIDQTISRNYGREPHSLLA